MATIDIKRHGGMILGAVIAVGAFGLLSWRLMAALGAADQIVEQLDSEERKLAELKRFRPFPSAENVDRLRGNRELLDTLYGKLSEAAIHQITVPEVDQVKFATMLARRVSELTRQARKAKIGLPEKFAFGFEEYIGVLPPNDSEVITTITKQLLVVGRISEMLYDSDTQSINQLIRNDVISQQLDGTPSLSPTGKTAAFLISRLPFEVRFTTTTSGLKDFLNALADEEWLFVVRHLDLEVRVSQLQVPISSINPTPEADPVAPWGEPSMPDTPAPTTRTIEVNHLEVHMRLELVECRIEGTGSEIEAGN